jgi:UDP-N-acetylmuramate--alanine ligase
MKIGIFFGGQSREREISFAGGRTVYDNLNKAIFEPVLIFIDSLGNFIHLDWKYAYKGTIRDFYPPFEFIPASTHNFQIYIESLGHLDDETLAQLISKVGKKIQPNDFSKLMDMAFLTLHGPYGEDGNIQGLLEWYHIPYTGSGILPSSIGVNKVLQKQIMTNAGFGIPDFKVISRSNWISGLKASIISDLKQQFDFPMVIKSPNQGSSIGISIVKIDDQIEEAIDKSFFIKRININAWKQLDELGKRLFLTKLVDIREGIGMPVYADSTYILHPEELWERLDEGALAGKSEVVLTSVNSEEEVLVESFISGREFSCIVIENELGKPIALPPTEIVKRQDLFDYRSKYLPGISRKETPIDLPDTAIEDIRRQCSALFTALHCDVYARIDGFYTLEGTVFLNDPNTTSGMLPSSFFFHQAAEIGLNPSQFLSFITRNSLAARVKAGKQNAELKRRLDKLDAAIARVTGKASDKIRVAVLMGGFSSERHISVESGRNIFEKLASSSKYEPVPVFLMGDESNHELYQLPVNIMLKDNADDIKSKIIKNHRHPILDKIAREAQSITSKYAGEVSFAIEKLNYDTLAERADFVFIALHGRPGEDGAVQSELNARQVPFNGSDVESSQITINKFETNKLLRENGILVANHTLAFKNEFEQNENEWAASIEREFRYPIIAKPADDGCSSAVKKITNRLELIAFARQMFRTTEDLLETEAATLRLKENEEFPQKSYFLIEDLIEKGNGLHFLEITGGMLTKRNEIGEIKYEVFHPSETLASGEILSLEEKFLAGEGQNITPPRYSKDAKIDAWVGTEVRKVLEKTAKVLNVEGYCRIDAFVRIFAEKVETIVIEVNSLPGMTPATAIFHQSALNGYKPYEFIDAIINYGMDKNKNSITLTLP